ncbi:MAG: class I SAM-dependent rRNA methyltransferase [Firmicutes bacterium]|nr:class I SAM-dependent rRNA methyltransferase [Bacillota bacterium]
MAEKNALRLKPGPHRVLEGSPWIYRGELFRNEAEPGTIVSVVDEHGHFVGKGLYNPRSIIAVRLLTRIRSAVIDDAWFAAKVEQAWAMRRQFARGREAFRVIHSEADGLPGLTVDKYGPMLVIEVASLGMVPFMPAIIEQLVQSAKPAGIYERGDLPVRDKEGLPRRDRLVYGEMISPVDITEHGVVMNVDIIEGQKTGHFLDQYGNRIRAGELAQDKTVFDAFCHTGGFGLACAQHGAVSVTGIDIDPYAIVKAEENARRNKLEERMRFVTANAFDWLRKESDQGPHYDLGVLDPPAFTKSRETVPSALKGYKEINLRGLKLINPGGILITASCSYHVSEAEFIHVVQQAAYDAHRTVKMLEIRGQGPDHPMLPALPESRYLKCLVLQVF